MQASTKSDDRDYLDDDSASDSEIVNGVSPVHRHHASSPAATSSRTRGKDEGRTLMVAAAPEVTFVAEKRMLYKRNIILKYINKIQVINGVSM